MVPDYDPEWLIMAENVDSHNIQTSRFVNFFQHSFSKRNLTFHSFILYWPIGHHQISFVPSVEITFLQKILQWLLHCARD